MKCKHCKGKWIEMARKQAQLNAGMKKLTFNKQLNVRQQLNVTWPLSSKSKIARKKLSIVHYVYGIWNHEFNTISN